MTLLLEIGEPGHPANQENGIPAACEYAMSHTTSPLDCRHQVGLFDCGDSLQLFQNFAKVLSQRLPRETIDQRFSFRWGKTVTNLKVLSAQDLEQHSCGR